MFSNSYPAKAPIMIKCCSDYFSRRAGAIVRVVGAAVAMLFVCCALEARASLGAYDAAILSDAAEGLTPLAKLTNAVTLTGANRAAFDFGNNSGDVTIEFVLQGNPSVGGASAYLAVGANATSNLRYEQFNNTGQLGFTQLGVADYLFSPVAPSPIQPTHIAYVWNATTRTMTLYVNGSVAGTSSGVSASFAMPAGVGWLGANPSSTETMTGTIYRVTVYDDIVSDDAIQRHADAYNDIVRLPIIASFTASPSAVFTPNSSSLTWNVQRATVLFINGVDVTTAPNLVVSPSATTTYTLTASNTAGFVTRSVTVLVNPPPVINSFTASRTYVGAGETIALNWNVSYGQAFSISPGVGDVTAQTGNGTGSINVQPVASTTYTLAASNAFGVSTATVEIHVVVPANHLVISEFMADNESTLADQDGDFSGWIEIHNPTAAAINLAGHFLTDDEADPTKWAFPNLNLAAGSYLVVFASGKDRINTAAPLHTSFNLNNSGEYMALVGPGPALLHAFAPAFPPQRENISYGILGGDVDVVRFMGVPTPGAANNETPAPPAPVQFSRVSGLFTNAFSLALTNSDPAAVILFTLNGSTPSATNGSTYSAPLTVTNTTRIRAIATVSNQMSRLAGASYIRLANDLVGYTSSLPIMVIENFGAGVIPVKPFNGNGAGIKQAPRQFAAWATFDRHNGISSLTNPPQMFGNIGIRARGGASSQWRQKPFGVEGIDEDGAERKLSPLGLPAHADWILYFPDADTANSKDATMLFNTFAFELSANSGRYSVRFRWVEAFLNEDGGDLRLADRRGVYAIVEKVSRGEDRLDFQRLSTDGTNGGWLLNINRMDSEPDYGWPAHNGATQPWFFHTAGPNRILQTADNSLPVQGDDEPQQINAFINFDNPNGYNINTNQRAAIQNWFKQFEDVLWNDAVWRNPVNGYRKYVDVVDFADFFVVNVLTRNSDGLLISIFPWKGDDNRLRMGPVWDFNYNTYYISGGPTGSLLWRSDRLWYRRLFADPDFLQLYIDRWWEHRRGPMSNAAMDAIIDGQAADISATKAVLNGVPSGAEWTNRLSQLKTWLKDRANWIDSNYLRPPTFNANGGEVPDGFQVAIYGTNGTIYFTVDGSDPRASGGAVAPGAQAYQVPFPLSAQTLVQARVKNGTNWSGLTAAIFYTPQDFTKLAITEIMYNPPAFGGYGGDELEFLELKNIGTNTLSLGTLTFTAGINFTFTNGTLLAPGQFFVLARNAAAFQSKYPGVPVNGVFTGRLDNSGETIRISTPIGNTVLAVTYNDRAPWPLAPDSYGFSLVPRNTLAPDNSDNGSHWRASTALGGSPGADDPAPTIAGVVINEILTHTDPPQIDAVELFNPTTQSVDISGWFLSDDGTTPIKFRIPNGTVIPGGGHVVFTETNFNPMPATLFNFSLDSAGDSIYLSSGGASTNLTGYSHGVNFGAAANGVSFGRYVNSVGEEQFPAQLGTTFSATNLGPVVGPIVISEIMYHPDADGDEFIELRNITSSDVPLFDPAHPTNTWRINGLGFIFPTNIVLPSNSLTLIVATNPAAFRAKYSVPAGVLVLGPFAGALQDSGERLELQRPDLPDTNGVAYITVDEVRYNDHAPWPPGADGGGPSLQRRVVSAYGNDPINWEAAVPTPGIDFIPGQSPVITAQPQNQTMVAYHDTTFSVSATGPAPFYFQWLFNGDPISDATNSTLVLTNVQPAQAGRYHAIVFNAAGSASSASAQLTVLIPAIIQQQPQSIATNAGRTVTFSVSAVGTGLSRYQWRFNGTNILNATSSSLVLTNVQPINEGVYTVVITDNVGDIASAPARLTVLFEPFFIQQPLSQSIPTGGTVTLSVVITNNATLPLGYRLRRNGVSLFETFFSTNERSAFFTITNIRAPLTNYAVVVTNAALPSGRGSASVGIALLPDTDGDGIPDAWEEQFGFETNSALDAFLDSDGDTMLNWQEWVAGTEPTNAASYLKFDAIESGGGALLTFGAISPRTYTIEFTDTLGSGAWSRLTNIVARSTNRAEQILDPNYTTNRFYRLVTPWRP
jgi:hypothetical protein